MSWIRKYVGIPFQEFGRDKNGVDCWGLVRLVYAQEFEKELPSYLGLYEDCKDSESLGELIPNEAENWQQVQPGQEEVGDVIVIRMRGVPMHTAIVTCPKRRTMLHVHEGIDTVNVKYHSMEWKNRIIGFYRHT